MTTTFLAIHFHIVITAIINLGRIAAVLGYVIGSAKPTSNSTSTLQILLPLWSDWLAFLFGSCLKQSSMPSSVDKVDGSVKKEIVSMCSLLTLSAFSIHHSLG